MSTSGEQKRRSVFFISDGTGITAEKIGHSVISQFPQIHFDIYVMPYVDNEERAHQVAQDINRVAQQDGLPPFVFDTLVDPKIRAIINTANATNLDIFEGLIAKMSQAMNEEAAPLVGHSHAVNTQLYKDRISAVHFALENDDGGKTRQYDLADIILIGVSRSGKTPTSLYLALQYGIRAANYPLTEDDLDDNRLPNAIRQYKHKLFGLTVDPDRLMAIRQERKPNSKYASYNQCHMEIRAAQAIYISQGIPFLDATEMSIEELSTRIIQEAGLKRRVG